MGKPRGKSAGKTAGKKPPKAPKKKAARPTAVEGTGAGVDTLHPMSSLLAYAADGDPEALGRFRDREAAIRDRAQQQYLRAARDLGGIIGGARGWKKYAAQQLGIAPEQLSKIQSGAVRVGMDLMTRACDRLGIGMDYFGSTLSLDEYRAAHAPPVSITDLLAVQWDAWMRVDGHYSRVPAEETRRLARMWLQLPPTQIAQAIVDKKDADITPDDAYRLNIEIQGLVGDIKRVTRGGT